MLSWRTMCLLLPLVNIFDTTWTRRQKASKYVSSCTSWYFYCYSWWYSWCAVVPFEVVVTVGFRVGFSIGLVGFTVVFMIGVTGRRSLVGDLVGDFVGTSVGDPVGWLWGILWNRGKPQTPRVKVAIPFFLAQQVFIYVILSHPKWKCNIELTVSTRNVS